MNGANSTRRTPPLEAEIVSDLPRGSRGSSRGSPPPVHPLAAVALLVVDNLWNLADWAVISWMVTIPLAFASVFLPTFLLHRHLLRQSRLRALGWAALLGGIAAVPFSVAGTATGALLLTWLGINHLAGRSRT
jgi:hypothetical protein